MSDLSAKQRTVFAVVFGVGGVLFLIALGMFAYVGLYSRYAVDDYCLASDVNKFGWLGTPAVIYMRASGRFVAFLLLGLAEYGGVITAVFTPLVLLVAWLVAGTWTLGQFNLLFKTERPWLIGFLLAEIVVLTTIDGTPNLFESLYWQTASLMYTLPLVLIIPYIGMLALVSREPDRARSKALLSLGAFLMFVAAGLSEINPPMQIVGCALGAAAGLTGRWPRLRPLAPLFLAGLIGALIGFGINVAAPGNLNRANAIRELGYLPATSVIEFALGLVKGIAKFGILSVLRGSLSELIAFVFPALIAFRFYPLDEGMRNRLPVKRMLMIVGSVVLAGLVLIAAGISPGALLFRTAPAYRALIIPRFVEIVVLAVCGSLVGIAARAEWDKRNGRISSFVGPITVAVAVVLLVAGPLDSARELVGYLPALDSFAKGWDLRDSDFRLAKANGVRQAQGAALIYPPELGRFEPDLLPSADALSNRCMARYYGFESITPK